MLKGVGNLTRGGNHMFGHVPTSPQIGNSEIFELPSVQKLQHTCTNGMPFGAYIESDAISDACSANCDCFRNLGRVHTACMRLGSKSMHDVDTYTPSFGPREDW